MEDLIDLAKLLATALLTFGGSVFYFKAKNKKLNAEAEKIEAETDTTTVALLTSAIDGLERIYSLKFKTFEETYELKLKHLTDQISDLNGKLDKTEKVYKIDRELLAIYKKAAEKMKDCPNFEQCPGAREFHRLTKI